MPNFKFVYQKTTQSQKQIAETVGDKDVYVMLTVLKGILNEGRRYQIYSENSRCQKHLLDIEQSILSIQIILIFARKRYHFLGLTLFNANYRKFIPGEDEKSEFA